jgi:hypothetical protein
VVHDSRLCMYEGVARKLFSRKAYPRHSVTSKFSRSLICDFAKCENGQEENSNGLGISVERGVENASRDHREEGGQAPHAASAAGQGPNNCFKVSN